MQRSLLPLLLVGLGVSALGCSDPVPAAAAVGLRLNIGASGSCPSNQNLPDDLGNPPPNKDSLSTTDPKKGRPVYDGSGVDASCRVSGSGPFEVNADVKASSVSFTISGTVMANGSGTADMSFNSSAIGETVAGSSCTLTAVPTDTGPGVKGGAIWATFSCLGLTAPGSPAINCNAQGEVLLENCSQ